MRRRSAGAVVRCRDSRRHGGTAVPIPRGAVSTLELALLAHHWPEQPEYDVHAHMVFSCDRSVKPHQTSQDSVRAKFGRASAG